MSKQLIRSSKPVFPKEDIDQLLLDIGEVLEDGQFSNGKNVKVFEKMVAQYVGVGNAVAFDSDSSAYETALRYFGVEGGEVVVCTNSFVSVPNSVVALAEKLFSPTYKQIPSLWTPKACARIFPRKTRGVIVTHISGFPNPDLKEIKCNLQGTWLVSS